MISFSKYMFWQACMIFSSTTFNFSTDKLVIGTFLSKLSFPLFTLYLNILILRTTHAITLNILHHDRNLFRICGTVSSLSTLLIFAVTVTLTFGSSWFNRKASLPFWFAQLDSSFHKNLGPLTQHLPFSWLDGDKPWDVSFAGLNFDSVYIHWLTSEFSLISSVGHENFKSFRIVIDVAQDYLSRSTLWF